MTIQVLNILIIKKLKVDYQFVYIDVGSYGAANDSSVFFNSNMGKRLQENLLKLPTVHHFANDESGKVMPFCIVADEAFALSSHILCPYAKKSLTVLKRIYNYQHTRAHQMVECTFGILCNKWRILHRAIDVNSVFTDNVIKACCILHNYVCQNDGIQFLDTAYDCPLESVRLDTQR